MFRTEYPNWKLAILLVCLLLAALGVGQDLRSAFPHQLSTRAQRTLPPTTKKADVGRAYQIWVDEDVRWIITDEERQAFKQLANDRERDEFIEAFWQRRDPTPDTYENEYKDEHYRRIVFANEQFGAFVPGWRTDRGRFYIMYGPPDEIVSHPTGRANRFSQQPIANHPYEEWHYRFLEGLGRDVVFPFADMCQCGDYRMVDNANPPQEDAEDVSPRIEAFVGISSGRANVRFKDLEEVLTHRVTFRLLPFVVRADLVKATDFTTMVPITIEMRNPDLTFVNKDGVQRAVVHIFGRFTNVEGRVVDTFEDEVQVDSTQSLAEISSKSTHYSRAAWLRPGAYRLAVAIQDVNGDRIGTEYRDVQVPGWAGEELGTSSLILADQVGPASNENGLGTGHFLVGKSYIRPRVQAPGVPAHFRKDQDIHVWMQVYGLAADEKSNRPSAIISYEVEATTAPNPLIENAESSEQMKSYGDQITLHKQFAAAQFKRGTYKLRIRVKDQIAHREVERSANFSVD